MRKDFGSNPWFYPLPVLIIGTYDEAGKPDAMNAAWGGLYDANLVELCLSESHKTTKNIKLKKAFTVSFADAENVAACDYVGIVSGNNTPDKMEKSGLTAEKERRGGRTAVHAAAPDPGVQVCAQHRGRQHHRRDRQHQCG